MDHVTSKSNFKIPDLTKLISKALQLDALQSVRVYTSSSFELLNKQKDTLKALLRDIQIARNRGMSLGIHGSDTNPTEDTTSQSVGFQNSPSQKYAYNYGPSVAEQTLQCYNPGDSNPKT